jgi:predicted DNA-binding transcriptional regulator YafY
MAGTRRAAKEKTAEARLLGLASWILEQQDPVTRRQIYDAFPDDYRGSAEAAEKKLSRDKDALRRLGFTLETEQLGRDEGQVGYSIDARSCTLPAIELSPDEAALLWTAGTAALRLSEHPLRDDLESALRKLVVGARGLPPRAAATEELASQVGARPPTPGQALGPGRVDRRGRGDETLEKLVDAWERRRRVRIRYWRIASGEEVERDVDVYGWASRSREWIFVGYCHLRQGVRLFYLSRVRSVRAAGGARDGGYEIPAAFDIRRWSRQQPWDYELHPPCPAVVRLGGALARIARQLMPGARVEADAAGGRVAALEVRNLRGLVRQVLAWGPDAELVEPEAGRKMALEILSSISGWSAP